MNALLHANCLPMKCGNVSVNWYMHWQISVTFEINESHIVYEWTNGLALWKIKHFKVQQFCLNLSSCSQGGVNIKLQAFVNSCWKTCRIIFFRRSNPVAVVWLLLTLERQKKVEHHMKISFLWSDQRGVKWNALFCQKMCSCKVLIV